MASASTANTSTSGSAAAGFGDAGPRTPPPPLVRRPSAQEQEDAIGRSIRFMEYDTDIGRSSERAVAWGGDTQNSRGDGGGTTGGRSDAEDSGDGGGSRPRSTGSRAPAIRTAALPAPVGRFGHGPVARMVDKMVWLFVLSNMLLTCWLITVWPIALPYVYIGQLALLVTARLVYYWRLKWIYFCMDTCYFGNALTIVYLLAFRDNLELFEMVFAVTNGPLLLAVIPYRNSFVPHNWDKVTSCYIHVFPALVTFTLRWHVVDTWWTCEDVTNPDGSHDTATLNETWTAEECDWPHSLWWVLLGGVGFFCAHQLFYFVVVQVIGSKRLREDKSYLTSYRYLMSLKGFVYKLATSLGYRYRVAGYAVISLVYGLLTLVPTPLLFHSYHTHVCVLIAACMVVLYNGGSFYMDVFSRKYAQSRGFAEVEPGTETLEPTAKVAPAVATSAPAGAETKVAAAVVETV